MLNIRWVFGPDLWLLVGQIYHIQLVSMGELPYIAIYMAAPPCLARGHYRSL